MGTQPIFLPAQTSTATPEIDIEALVEELFSMQEEDINHEEIYENLLQHLLNPIDLNRSTREELQSIYVFTPHHINNFLNYKEKFGPLLSLYELQAVPGFDLDLIYRILPFVTLEDDWNKTFRPFPGRVLTERNAYFMIRHRRVWEKRRGFTPPDTLSGGRSTSRYLGDPNDLYARFRIQHQNDFSLGFTVDKDAGEQFTWDPSTKRYGFNFLSYHFTLYQKKRWKIVTVGDFQAQFGQGLVFGSGFSPGKGGETITTVKRSSTGVKPFTSAMEHGFFRGAAVTYSLGRFEVSGLFSNAPRDGNIQSSPDSLENQEQFLSSLPQSGYHRTPTEISNKSKALEKSMGVNLTYRNTDNSLSIGTNALYSNFSQPYFKVERIYNGFEFRGKSNHVHSMFFSYNYQNYFFFGESAISKSYGTAMLGGVMASLSPQLDLSVLWRDYKRDFHSFYGNAFSENSNPINEKGVYLGLQYRPSRNFQWNGYLDRFYSPWLRFRTYAPSGGYEWLSKVTYSRSRNLTVFFQVREKTKRRNISVPVNLGAGYNLADGRKRNYVINLDMVVDKTWSIKSRVQFSNFDFNGSKTKGFAIIQDIRGQWNKWRLSSRIALFDTNDYENRQYIYERNVLWAFSLPNYSGQGIRYYLLGQYQVNKQLTFWARWARTSFTDRQTIGSGLQAIEGNRMNETTLQLRYQFNR